VNVSPGLVRSPNRPVTRYVPAGASRMPAGQPGADRLRAQVTVNDTGAAPGCNVTTCDPPPGEQSSLDQTRSLPLTTRISRAACPTSRVQGNVPLFAMPMVSTGRRPAGYACASAFADSTRSAALHGPSGGVVLGLALGLDDTDADAFGDPDGFGFGFGEPVAEGDGDWVSVDGFPPPPPQDRATSSSTTSTTANVIPRRRQ
jgi:hypothetical protein